MSESIALRPGVVDLIATAGSRFLGSASGDVRIASSDVVLVVANAGSDVVLERQERGHRPAPVMRASSAEDVERYLVRDYGYDARSRLGVGRIVLPRKPGQEASGFRVVDAGDGWYALAPPTSLLDTSRAVGGTVWADEELAVGSSHLAEVPVDALVASYRAPDGAPALTKFVWS